MKTIISISFSLLISLLNLQAQELSPQVISSAGDYSMGSDIRLDWTLGELAITTIESPNQQISQGFHQAYFFTTLHVEDLPTEVGTINVAPNPTSDWIELQMSFHEEQTIQLLLIDLSGKTIWSEKLKGQELKEKYSLKDLASGNYYLTFQFEGNKYSKSFQINKQ